VKRPVAWEAIDGNFQIEWEETIEVAIPVYVFGDPIPFARAGTTTKTTYTLHDSLDDVKRIFNQCL